MSLEKIIPTPAEFIHEGILVAGGLIIAALILSRFPKLKEFISAQSITVKDSSGKELI